MVQQRIDDKKPVWEKLGEEGSEGESHALEMASYHNVILVSKPSQWFVVMFPFLFSVTML
jgi:hypothetical protein